MRRGLLARLGGLGGFLGLQSRGGNGSGRPLEQAMAIRRAEMVQDQILRRGIRDPRVLEAMQKIERHRFVPDSEWPGAYGDHPLPIGEDQTISQPFIVALMTEALALRGGERVLELGTGSGYQTAILAELAGEVYSIELLPSLAERARLRLSALGYRNVEIRLGDGTRGWPERAPFDAILVAAAPARVPRALLDQLGEGGRLVIPVGIEEQVLELYTREGGGFRRDRLTAVRFVPLRMAEGD